MSIRFSTRFLLPLAAVLGLTLSLTNALPASAFAPEGDLMKVKGYSPEVIKLTDQQRSRQEWQAPAPRRQTPREKFFHNIYYGDWTDGIDDFGAQILRDN